MSTTTARRTRPAAFDIKEPSLKSVLDGVHSGQIKLPAFHREWCWPGDNIQSLLGSIAERHPIGAAMFVSATSLSHRPLHGSVNAIASPVHLVLDGQQRITAAYQACYKSTPVEIMSGTSSEYRLYFFIMEKAASPDVVMDNAIISMEVDRAGKRLNDGGIDYTDPVVQYERGIFPSNLIFSFDEYEQEYREFWDGQHRGSMRAAALQNLRDFRSAVIASFEAYKLPIQVLPPMETTALCRVYEKVNSPVGEKY